MEAHNMTDAIKHPHQDVPFVTIGDDIITTLTTLAAILKNKYKKPLSSEIIESPIKAAKNRRTTALIQPIITSPAKHNFTPGRKQK
jgi:hypothetical protein